MLCCYVVTRLYALQIFCVNDADAPMVRQFPIFRQNINVLRTCPPNESGAEDYFRIADIHDKSVSRGQKLSRRASEKRVHKILRCFSSRSCLSAVVPLRLRTRHPFAVSAPKGLHRRLSL